MSSHAKPSFFNQFANYTAHMSGHPLTFTAAVAVILVWAVTGPIFGYSDTWQLVINTGTTIVTFLMVFLIQNTQNRDSKMIQLKLDELIRAQAGAETRLIDMDNMCEADLEGLRVRYLELAQQAGRRLKPEDLKIVVEETVEAVEAVEADAKARKPARRAKGG